MITPDRMAECEWLGDAKSIAPAARQAIRDLAAEVKELHAHACMHGSTCPLIETNRKLTAEVEGLTAERNRARDAAVALEQENARLRAELELAFSPGMYLDIQKVLDEALGTNEADGAGGGIVADIALLADQKRAAEAEAKRLRGVADNIRYLHRVHSCDGPPEDCPCANARAEAGGAVCAHCTRPWPCPTAMYVRALDGEVRS